MAKNIEIKASLDNIQSCLEKVKSLSSDEPETIQQEDFFFNCDNGRLKLRFFSHQKGELIFYNRKNEGGPRISEYDITETIDPDRLLNVLEKAYGICGIVKKTRTLFLIGRTRVHIDCVENLGDYIELEVVLSEDENVEAGKAEAHLLMDQLGIESNQLIDCAYVDLISAMKI